MSKVLLINPMIPTMPKGTRCLSTGLLWIGSYLKQNDYEVKMIDVRNEENYKNLIKREVDKSLCVGVTAMTAQIPNALEICNLIKEKDSDTPIIWGGIHPILFPEGTINDEMVDVSCYGEGEYVMLNLAKCFEGYIELDKINGIAYKKDGLIKLTKPEKDFNMDELSSVSWDLMDESILKKPEKFEFPVHTGRGCCHRCTFCHNVISGTKYRHRDTGMIMKDLEDLKELGAVEIRFRDDNFFIDKNMVERITKEMIEKEMGFMWYGSMRVDYLREGHIDMKIMKYLKESGCQWLAFGAESGSQKILDILKKDITVEQTIQSAKICREVGIKPVYSFIIGIPEETEDDIMMSLNLIDKLKKICPDARINGPQILRVYPSGELYDQCKKLGWKEPKTLKEWKDEVIKDMAYVTARDLPWVKNSDLLDAVCNTSFSNKSLNVLIRNKKPLLKLLSLMVFIDSKIRWKSRFFGLPFDIKLIQKLRRYEYKI